MQADKGSSQIPGRVMIWLRHSGQVFSRWARGGQMPSVASNKTILNKSLAAAARPQSAQSILEFLLVSVPLLALIFGILEIGLAFFESTNLDFAAQEAARSVSVCANGCDVLSGTTLYRDYNMLRALNRVSIRMENVEYILVQHVGEQVDDPDPDGTVAGPAGQPNLGRTGPDIYDNYKYQWQLYALPKPAANFPANDPRVNSVPARPDNDSLGVKWADAKCTEIPLLTVGAACALPKQPFNDQYNGFRSNPCFSTDDASICRKDIPLSDRYGVAIGADSAIPSWPGRYICVPTDRFYVQLVYRHNWITPFMPTLNLDGNTPPLRGFGPTNSLILSSKAYQKVEPRQFAGTSGTAGC
jgi:hypothetical protein